MPRHQRAMKDVAVCDKPRGAGKQALIRGFPNGETHERKPFVPRVLLQAPNNEFRIIWNLKRSVRGVPAEVKHLSKRRKRKQTRVIGLIP